MAYDEETVDPEKAGQLHDRAVEETCKTLEGGLFIVLRGLDILAELPEEDPAHYLPFALSNPFEQYVKLVELSVEARIAEQISPEGIQNPVAMIIASTMLETVPADLFVGLAGMLITETRAAILVDNARSPKGTALPFGWDAMRRAVCEHLRVPVEDTRELLGVFGRLFALAERTGKLKEGPLAMRLVLLLDYLPCLMDAAGCQDMAALVALVKPMSHAAFERLSARAGDLANRRMRERSERETAYNKGGEQHPLLTRPDQDGEPPSLQLARKLSNTRVSVKPLPYFQHTDEEAQA